MNILVTGSNGFIGGNFKKFTKNDKNNKYIWATTSQCEGNLKVEKNYNNIISVLEDFQLDCVIHLAAVIPYKFEEVDFNDIFLPNVIMMENIKQLCISKKIKKLIYLSSYGTCKIKNEHETVKDYYTLSKIHGEYVCSMLEYEGIETASFRIPSPYGPYSKAKNVINLFIEKAINNEDINVYGTGKREQNFIYIKDILIAIQEALDSKNKLSGIYDIVSEKNTSMLELAYLVKDILKSNSKILVGKAVDPQEDYKPTYNYDRAFKELNYKPRYSIYDGLSEYIKWYLENNENSSDF